MPEPISDTPMTPDQREGRSSPQNPETNKLRALLEEGAGTVEVGEKELYEILDKAVKSINEDNPDQPRLEMSFVTLNEEGIHADITVPAARGEYSLGIDINTDDKGRLEITQVKFDPDKNKTIDLVPQQRAKRLITEADIHKRVEDIFGTESVGDMRAEVTPDNKVKLTFTGGTKEVPAQTRTETQEALSGTVPQAPVDDEEGRPRNVESVVQKSAQEAIDRLEDLRGDPDSTFAEHKKRVIDAAQENIRKDTGLPPEPPKKPPKPPTVEAEQPKQPKTFPEVNRRIHQIAKKSPSSFNLSEKKGERSQVEDPELRLLLQERKNILEHAFSNNVIDKDDLDKQIRDAIKGKTNLEAFAALVPIAKSLEDKYKKNPKYTKDYHGMVLFAVAGVATRIKTHELSKSMSNEERLKEIRSGNIGFSRRLYCFYFPDGIIKGEDGKWKEVETTSSSESTQPPEAQKEPTGMWSDWLLGDEDVESIRSEALKDYIKGLVSTDEVFTTFDDLKEVDKTIREMIIGGQATEAEAKVYRERIASRAKQAAEAERAQKTTAQAPDALTQQLAQMQERQTKAMESQAQYFESAITNYPDLVEVVSAQDPISPTSWLKQKPLWYRALGKDGNQIDLEKQVQEQAVVRNMLNHSYFAGVKKAKGENLDASLKPETFSVEQTEKITINREAMDTMWWSMPGYRIAYATMMDDLFELSDPDPNAFDCHEKGKDINYYRERNRHLVVSEKGRRIILGQDKKDRRELERIKSKIERGEKLEKDEQTRLTEIETELERWGQLPNSITEYKLDLEHKITDYFQSHSEAMQGPFFFNNVDAQTAAKAAVSQIWNEIFTSGDIDSGDEDRELLIGPEVVSLGYRTYFHPQAQLLFKSKPESSEEGPLEEQWGGPIGQWMTQKIKHDPEFGERVAKGEIQYFPDRIMYGLHDHWEFSEGHYKGHSFAQGIMLSGKTEIAPGLLDFVNPRDIRPSNLKDPELWWRYSMGTADSARQIFETAVGKKMEEKGFSSDELVNAINAIISNDPWLAHLVVDEDTLTACVANLVAKTSGQGIIANAEEIVFNMNPDAYDDTVRIVLYPLIPGIKHTRQEADRLREVVQKVRRNLNARDIDSQWGNIRNFLGDDFLGIALTNRERTRRKAAKEATRVIRSTK